MMCNFVSFLLVSSVLNLQWKSHSGRVGSVLAHKAIRTEFKQEARYPQQKKKKQKRKRFLAKTLILIKIAMKSFISFIPHTTGVVFHSACMEHRCSATCCKCELDIVVLKIYHVDIFRRIFRIFKNGNNKC